MGHKGSERQWLNTRCVPSGNRYSATSAAILSLDNRSATHRVQRARDSTVTPICSLKSRIHGQRNKCQGNRGCLTACSAPRTPPPYQLTFEKQEAWAGQSSATHRVQRASDTTISSTTRLLVLKLHRAIRGRYFEAASDTQTTANWSCTGELKNSKARRPQVGWR